MGKVVSFLFDVTMLFAIAAAFLGGMYLAFTKHLMAISIILIVFSFVMILIVSFYDLCLVNEKEKEDAV